MKHIISVKTDSKWPKIEPIGTPHNTFPKSAGLFPVSLKSNYSKKYVWNCWMLFSKKRVTFKFLKARIHWNISFRLFRETHFNTYFITFNLISWNSCKMCKKKASASYDRKKKNTKRNQVFNLLLIEQIFSKKTTKQKTKRERSIWVKP